eukprot:4383549-Lingulodinium_polyedra.AAC.1
MRLLFGGVGLSGCDVLCAHRSRVQRSACPCARVGHAAQVLAAKQARVRRKDTNARVCACA